MLTHVSQVLRNPRWQSTLTVQRPESGVFVNGIWVRGEDPTTLTLKGVVIPLTRLALPETFPYERVLARLEGIRVESSLVVYTFEQLRTFDDDQTPGDRVVNFRGKTWEVLSCERWDEYGFWVSILVMLNAQVTV